MITQYFDLGNMLPVAIVISDLPAICFYTIPIEFDFRVQIVTNLSEPNAMYIVSESRQVIASAWFSLHVLHYKRELTAHPFQTVDILVL